MYPKVRQPFLCSGQQKVMIVPNIYSSYTQFMLWIYRCLPLLQVSRSSHLLELKHSLFAFLTTSYCSSGIPHSTNLPHADNSTPLCLLTHRRTLTKTSSFFSFYPRQSSELRLWNHPRLFDFLFFHNQSVLHISWSQYPKYLLNRFFLFLST